MKPGHGGGGGYWGGRPLWDISTYLHQHRWDTTQTFMVDSPSDNLQTHKVSGRNSSRGEVGGPGWSRARATCGSLEPCACDLGSTKIVRVRPADHMSYVRATCGPQKPCARDLRTTRAVRTRPADHTSCASATCSPLEPCTCDKRTTRAVRVQPGDH